MKRIFTIIFLLSVLFNLNSQTVDTIFNKRHYKITKYYSGNNTRELSADTKNTNYYAFGNYIDTLQEGHWIYFYPTGKVFANGFYKNGNKIGKWTYYYFDCNQESVKVKYSKKWIVKDKVSFDNSGKLLMIDIINDGGEIRQIVRATEQKPIQGRIRFL
jgi:antitoxin component YwqK of YwqJK toxin-antitoxin module